MKAIEIKNGFRVATVSQWTNSGGTCFVVKGRNGGATKTFKTLDGAIKAANKYVGN